MGFRSIDFFRKLTTETETSSSLGGILTILAFTVFSVLRYSKIGVLLSVNESKIYF
jgi:hypothetical protein